MDSHTLTVIAIITLAAFTRSALGFGDALLAMPPLALLLGMKTATPLVALVASTIALTILLQTWRKVDLRITWRLVLSTLAGIPIGLFFLTSASESAVKGVLGVVLIGFGLYNLVSPTLPTLRSERWSYLFGFAAGILGGAYNTNGPPVVLYGTLRKWSPERFRATLQGYFLPTGGTILISHGLAGMWTMTVWRLYLTALPAVLLGVLLGGWVHKRLPAGRFQKLVYAALVVMGVLLLV